MSITSSRYCQMFQHIAKFCSAHPCAKEGLDTFVTTILFTVTAAVHQILDRGLTRLAARSLPILNYWHWAGVSPYTSSFDLAGTCVFDKQSLSGIHCAQQTLRPLGGHLANLRPVVLQSSLRIVLSITFVYSTRPPVLVCSTDSYVSFTEFFLKTENFPLTCRNLAL